MSFNPFSEARLQRLAAVRDRSGNGQGQPAESQWAQNYLDLGMRSSLNRQTLAKKMRAAAESRVSSQAQIKKPRKESRRDKRRANR